MPTTVPIKPRSKKAILGGMVIDVELWQQARSLQTEIALPHDWGLICSAGPTQTGNQLFQHQENETRTC
jgi:hypothetical protein